MAKLALTKTRRTYLISDTHFDHSNIIRYCHRPFNDTAEMNSALIRNWNETIQPKDTVYFLGDLCWHGDPFRWLEKLNGDKVLIGGGHDRHIPQRLVRPYDTISIDGLEFYLVHNPLYVPPEWEGWVIHGHIHNNDLKNYPLINRQNRTINVSVELTGYKPISLASILDTIKNGR